MTHVIFSIDGQDDPMQINRFNNILLNTLGVPFGVRIGCYNGVTEWAWIVGSASFYKHIASLDCLSGQESVLEVTECNKQYATLVYPVGRGADGAPLYQRKDVGCMHEVSEAEALASDGWTYDPLRDTYWTARQGNPDRGGAVDRNNPYADHANAFVDALKEICASDKSISLSAIAANALNAANVE